MLNGRASRTYRGRVLKVNYESHRRERVKAVHLKPKLPGSAVRRQILLIAFLAAFGVNGPGLDMSNGLFAQTTAPVIHPDEARQHLRWNDARRAVGEEAFISGKVINVNSAGRVNFLNFDAARPAKFTGIVFRESLGNFPSGLKETYDGKIIRIRGMVTLYRDRPQIVITKPDQIEILDELPPTTAAETVGRRPTVDGQLSVATYNVLNLFDAEDDPYHADESTPAKSRDQLKLLAESMVRLNADVVALQEVESRGYLKRFVDVFLPDMGYDHIVHFEGNDLRGIDVCLVSRVQIGAVRSHRHLQFDGPDDSKRRFSRDVLAVSVEPDGAQPVQVWVVHLKSNSGGREFAEPIRLAESRALRGLLDEEFAADPEARIVLVGDFNDVWGSPTLETIVGAGPTGMWSAASSLGGALPDTYNTGEYRSMIDFILCSPAMKRHYVGGSLRIPPGSPEATGSDHNPVAARFRLD